MVAQSFTPLPLPATATATKGSKPNLYLYEPDDLPWSPATPSASTPPLSPSLLPVGATTVQQLALAGDLLADVPQVTLDGSSLTLGQLVAAARREVPVQLGDEPAVKQRIDQSVAFLHSKLHTSIYGVSTGYGGSADTRSQNFEDLQKALLEHQLAGVLPTSSDFSLGRGLENALPEEVVRGAMIVRVNSLSRGHSAVRYEILETLLRLLNEGITPVVPVRGSISASGDLSPLSYIAAAICGHPDVRCTTRISGKLEIMSSADALKRHGITPIVLGPKEGLGLVNGTAVSASFASMALHDVHFVTLLSQAVTGMTVEAMLGHVGSFHPFIHDVARPHPGQVQMAQNIRTLLQGSTFAVHFEEECSVEEDTGVLRQDRYALRTSAQFVGPSLSELIGSHSMLVTELNSTTDNPLVDVAGGIIHHGGNFQGSSVAMAMEKTRLSLQHFGKLSFAQLTEMANCQMNRGLPSCLAAEDPSTSYHVKGIDIACASYCSELGFLANPVTTHVQPAEMNNQAINSLALISARKTFESLDVLSMLLASHLYCCCMALDLRYIDSEVQSRLSPFVVQALQSTFRELVGEKLESVTIKVRHALYARLESSGSQDLVPRWADAFKAVTPILMEACADATVNPIPIIAQWRDACAAEAVKVTRECREAFFADQESGKGKTAARLGKGSRLIYSFVRDTVGVKARRGDVYMGRPEATIGTNVSKLYESIKSGRINRVLVEAFA